jgi:protein involved in polysaccharide export with SLBB domain
MKKIHLLGLLGWLGLASVCPAQLSTFPSPPPLPPPSSSETTTNGTSNVPVSPDFGITNPGGNGGSSASSASTSSTSDGNSSIPATAEMLTSMTALDDKITLQPGDRISFRVIEDKDQAVPRIVTDTGEVDFPYIGRVKVQGETCHDLAIELKRLLEVDYYKRATVIVGLDVIADRDKDKPKTHDLAWISGQVRQIGPQELSKEQPMTVSQIIMRAGGFGDFADQRRVKLIHRSALASANGDVPPGAANPEDIEIVDVKAVFEGKSSIDPTVQPNDFIIVPRRAVNY